METAGDAAASGGCSIRDLPPSKRFKFVGSNLGSAPCLPMPPKKRAFPPPPPEAAPVPLCLPAKKRAYAAAVKACLPVKKRGYSPPVDETSPEDAAPAPSVPSRKSVQAQSCREDAAARLPVLAKKRIQMRSGPVAATTAPPVPAKKRVQTLSPLRNAGAPPTVPAKKRVQAPSLAEDAAAPLSAPAKKLFQVPRRTEDATAAPSVQAPSPTVDAAAPLSVPARKLVQVASRPEAAPSVQAKKRVDAPSPKEDAAALPSVPNKQRVPVPSYPERAVSALPSVPAKQRVPVPSCPERAVAAPSVSAKQRVLVPSRPEGAAALSSKRGPSSSAPDDASALFPVCLPANKRVMSQFIPPTPSPSMKSDGDRVAGAKETRPEGSLRRGGATNSSVANGAGDCPGAEASKMPDGPNEVKDPVVAKSRRGKSTARKASHLHCKKLSDVISGMQSEVRAEVPKTFEQASDVYSKKLSDVVNGVQSEVHAEVLEAFEQASDVYSKKLSDVVNGVQSEVRAEVLEAFEQASDVHCKKLWDIINGKHSEVQDEVLKTLEQTSDVHCKKLSNVVNDKHSEVQDEVHKAAEQASDVHCKKLSSVVNGKYSEVQDDVHKAAEQAIVPNVVAPAREEEPRKESEVAAGQEQDAPVEEDDGVLCAVCRSTDGDPSDPIVFCDGCDLMVHAACYGNPLAQAIPEGDWFCSLCSDKAAKKGKPARPPCCLCPARGGAMKRTTDGAWAHISCALLVPEVFFQDPDGRDAIDCSLVPARRFTKQCYLCESSRGCALECSQSKCDLGFHVSCGLNVGQCIEYREAKGGGVVASFCLEHTKIWEKQQLTGKYKIVSRGH